MGLEDIPNLDLDDRDEVRNEPSLSEPVPSATSFSLEPDFPEMPRESQESYEAFAGASAEHFAPSMQSDAPSHFGETTRRSSFNTVMRTILLMLLALAVGVGAGIWAYPHIPFPGTAATLPGKVTVSANELGTALGTYTYRGEQTTVTVRDAIEESTSLDAAKNADGTYEIPSVDAVLSIARNRILLDEASSRGITATDEETAAYAEETLGTNDYSVIASSYSMSVEQVQQLMRRSAILKNLRDAVVTTESLAEPAAPAAPEGGKEDDPTPEYAQYIIALVGDEWDANANGWAREDGPFREQLRDYTISNDAATYSAAQAAYYVAYAQYSTVQQQISTEWTTYVNEILSEVTVELNTLVA